MIEEGMVDEKEIDFMIDQNLAQRAIDIWGVEAQLFIAAEELAELIQVISKYNRYGDEVKDWVIEETADVLLMIMQLLHIIDVNPDIIRDVIHNKQDIIREKIENVEKNTEENLEED